MRPRMRKCQRGSCTSFISKREKVQVQRSCFIQDFFWGAAEFFLNLLKFREQRLGGFATARNKTDNGIYESRRIGRTIDGCGIEQ